MSSFRAPLSHEQFFKVVFCARLQRAHFDLYLLSPCFFARAVQNSPECYCLLQGSFPLWLRRLMSCPNEVSDLRSLILSTISESCWCLGAWLPLKGHYVIWQFRWCIVGYNRPLPTDLTFLWRALILVVVLGLKLVSSCASKSSGNLSKIFFSIYWAKTPRDQINSHALRCSRCFL